MDATISNPPAAGSPSTEAVGDVVSRTPELPTPEPSIRPGMADMEDADFAVVLLQALTNMALRSKRRQADLTAALRGAGLPTDLPRVRGALRLLYQQGAIDNLVPLSDGGLLLSVTRRATERIAPGPDWLALDELDATAG